MQWAYLIGLTIAIICLVLIDWRKKLALFYDYKRSLSVIAIAMIFFIIWDLFGIDLGIFFSGNSVYASHIMLLPDFPIEELFFLFLFCYLTLLIYRFVRKTWVRISF
jgi:lycopene cyclase domain-containing protein